MKKYKTKTTQTKILKGSKGITLIALVITIIVLLILAAISIATLTGDNGILTKANESKEETRVGEVKEAVALAVSENSMTDYARQGAKKSRQAVIDELQKDGKLTDDEVEYLADNDKITIGSIEIDFSPLGKVGPLTLVEMYDKALEESCTNENGDCVNPEHLHIGDYVNYTNPTSKKYQVDEDVLGEDTGVQVYEITEEKNQLNWRVLGKDSETEGIKLIAGSPMKSNDESSPYLKMNGAKGYVNSLEQLKNICELYSSELGTGRSVTQKDIGEITGIMTKDEINKVNVYSLLGSNYGDPYEFSDHYTPESWLDGQTRTTVEGELTGYLIPVIPEELDDEVFPYVKLSNKRIYDMLFDNTEVSGKLYWLASLGVMKGSDFAGFGVGSLIGNEKEGFSMGMLSFGFLFNSKGQGNKVALSVRPVIALKSSVSSDDIQKIPDKMEERWNYVGGGPEEQN